jgi:hypothetical protein
MKPKKSRASKSAKAKPKSPARRSEHKAGPKAQPARTTKRALVVPAILFEGDELAPPPATGPGEKYVLGPIPPPSPAGLSAALPEAYGTGRLLLAARDPHCIYAHWDLTAEQLRHYNTLSAQHHLVLRVRPNTRSPSPASEVQLPSEARHWFIPVEQAGAEYTVELGYYQTGGQWNAIAPSASVTTLPEAAAQAEPPKFATMTFQAQAPPAAEATVPMTAGPQRELSRWQVKGSTKFVPVNIPRGTSARAKGPPSIPLADQAVVRARVGPAQEPLSAQPDEWTAARAQALAQVIRRAAPAPMQSGSLEITELIRGGEPGPQPSQAAAMGGAVAFSNPAGREEAVSSPEGGELPARQGFWLNVNAELIVYGATDPGAQVTIGGRPIQLRPDGTFSCRLALPDGSHQLTVGAVSPEGDARGVELRFYRSTTSHGQVGEAAGDPSLRPPSVDNVS